MSITESAVRAACPLFTGRGLDVDGFTMLLPHKTYLSCSRANIDQEKDILCVYNYDLAERVVNDGEDVAAFGIYVETGGETDQIVTPKHMYSFDFFFKLSEDYAGASLANKRNADVRCGRIQTQVEGSLDGVAHGVYMAVRLSGGETFLGRYLESTSSYGGIVLELRSETRGSGTVVVGDGTSYGFAGLVLTYKGSNALTGNYHAIALNAPYEGGAISGITVGMYFFNTVILAGTAFDRGIDFASQTVLCINVDDCETYADIDATPSGSSAKNVMAINVTDSTTGSSGYARGFYVNYTSSGIKTGSGEANALAVDLAISANLIYGYCVSLYMSQSNNPSGYMAAISVYMDNMGTGVTGLMCLDLQLAQSSTPADTTRFCFMRVRNQSSQVPTAVMRLEGAPTATYLLSFDAIDGASMVTTSSGATTVTHKIAVNLNGTVRYIKLYSDT